MAKKATRVELDDTPEAVTSYLRQRRMTDGLPVVPPTEGRVAAMIDASGFDAALYYVAALFALAAIILALMPLASPSTGSGSQ